MRKYHAVGGSVPGWLHTRPGQPGWTNNQDSFHIEERNGNLATVVTDGCGSSEHSEVGAKVGARIIANLLLEYADSYVRGVRDYGKPEEDFPFWYRLGFEIKMYLDVVISAMGKDPRRHADDYLLFTILGALVTPYRTFVFGLGDGIYSLNGKLVEIGPYPGNAPPYLYHSLTARDGWESDIELYESIPTDELESLILGTDGVLSIEAAKEEAVPGQGEKIGGLGQFSDEKYFRNPDMIRRRLSILNRERISRSNGRPSIRHGFLDDDTTVVSIRRSDE